MPELLLRRLRDDGAFEDQGTLKYALDGIEVRGNSKTRSRVVLRYVPFRPGDIFDVDDPRVELTRYRLLGTGFLSHPLNPQLRSRLDPGNADLKLDDFNRNTLIINDPGRVLRRRPTPPATPSLTAYAGLDVAETNRRHRHDPRRGRRRRARSIRTEAQVLRSVPVPGRAVDDQRHAALQPRERSLRSTASGTTPASGHVDRSVRSSIREVGGIGVGRDLSVSTQLWANYRLERISSNVPRTANTVRGVGDGHARADRFHILPKSPLDPLGDHPIRHARQAVSPDPRMVRLRLTEVASHRSGVTTPTADRHTRSKWWTAVGARPPTPLVRRGHHRPRAVLRALLPR